MIIINQLKKYTVIGILFVIVLGTISHFIYKWTGNNSIIGFFAPVNESTWEHMKLLFFPMLVYSFFMNKMLKQDYECITSSLAFGTLLGTFLIPIIFYTYTGILGYHLFILDIFTFIVSVIIAFLAAYKLTLSCNIQSYASTLYILVVFVTLCFLVFTYCPPDLGLFVDPTI